MTDEQRTEQPVEWVGITTAAGALDKGEGLVNWANRLGLEGTALNDYRRNAQAAGTTKHRMLELAASGRTDTLPERDRSAAAGWLDAIGGADAILATELAVAHEELRYRGRIDAVRIGTAGALLALKAADEDDASPLEVARRWELPIVVVDYKSSGRPYAQDHLQIAGCVHALRALGYRCERGEIVQQIGGQVRVTFGAATDEDWLCVLACYRAGQRIRHRLDKL